MKHSITYITFLLVLNLSYGQTTLAAGDIAITGFNSFLPGGPDGFSFVLLTDIENGTQIQFTDQGWLSAGGFRVKGEGIITWTATSDLSCGTEITINYDTAGTIYIANLGGALETNLGFLLDFGGDQLLAYQGSMATPTFIYAINFDGAGWSDAVDADTSALPTGLIDGVNAVDLGETNSAQYDCSILSNPSLILAALSDNTLWNLSSIFIPLVDCGFSCTVICTGVTATWNAGGWENGIIPDITTPALITAAYNTTPNGSFRACSLIVSTNSTLIIADNDFIEIENDITVNAGSTIIVQPKGAVLQNDNFAKVIANGNITVVKKTAPANNWYEYTYWSSPVSGENISSGLADAETSRRFWFDASKYKDSGAEINNDNALTFGFQDDIDDNGDDWQLASGTDIMIPGVGYASTHDEFLFNASLGNQFDYTFNGPFNNGVVTVPIYRNDEELEDNNWNLIGNPYPSAIDATKFLAVNTTVDTSVTQSPTITGALFLWSQNTAPSANTNGNENENFVGSDYAVINGTGNVAGGDGLTPNNYIPSGQSFFVSMSDDAPSTIFSFGDTEIIGNIMTTNIIFNNAMRVTGSNDQFFKATSSKTKEDANKIWVNLTSDNGVFNQILIGYVKGATNGFDGDYYDAPRNLSTDNASILYSIIEGNNKKFSIQGKTINSLNKNEVITVGFKTEIDVPTIYTLSIAQLEGAFLNENPIYLKDNLLNTLHNLKESNYNFTSIVGEFNNRFEIVFNENALSSSDQAITNKSLSIFELQNGNVQFKLSGNIAMNSIQIIDLQGRVLYHLKTGGNTKTYNLSNLSHAPYIAKVILVNGTIITKKVVKRY
jgi:hypothetical protein